MCISKFQLSRKWNIHAEYILHTKSWNHFHTSYLCTVADHMDKQAANLYSCLFETTSKFALSSFDAPRPNPLTNQKISAFDRWNRQTAIIVMIQFGCFVGIFVSTFLTFRFGVWRQRFLFCCFFLFWCDYSSCIFLHYFFSSRGASREWGGFVLFFSFRMGIVVMYLFYYSYFHCCLFLNCFDGSQVVVYSLQFFCRLHLHFYLFVNFLL